MALPRGRFEHAARAGDHREDGGGAVDERREACRDVLLGLGLGLGLGFGLGLGLGFGFGLEACRDVLCTAAEAGGRARGETDGRYEEHLHA